ncbi:hypothetical protein DAPPUDRAFT_313564 [Daphnia pulex]|uniref:Uncharacterized protein n=1 Tax=Daphnia pulex TaxID=6669 RepID=E9G3H4_DAPPU|nr:hypothetical protein DAPPUDRAFT_313564 [Daphnia pulex]|eukprot:EFX85989.1 hypothetical protein DAPPUDRAFT_313564 [Daphnia pulex]
MLSTLIVYFIGFQSVIGAQIHFGGQPLFSGVTLLTFEVSTSFRFQPTVCFISSGKVSQCRRKRGIEEKPHMVQFGDLDSIIPSAVIGIEATLAPNDFSHNGFD